MKNNTVQEVAFNEVNAKVEKAQKALEEFYKLDQKKVDYIVGKASIAALAQHGVLAKHAIDETNRGVFEDKATKNLFACEYVVNRMKKQKTVGIVYENEIEGLTYVADPVGVVCGVTPVTNPTSTTIFKSLICLKTRNPIIFGFHPSAQACSVHAAQVVYEAAVEAGAPKHCIQWIENPSLEATNALMNHDGVATILATGGNAMVKAAYSCGKPALGVGAGNVPAYVEKSADIKQAANDIVMSKAFDNGMVCASEQAAIIDKEVYKEFVNEIKELGCYFVNKSQKGMLEEFMFGVKSTAKNYTDAKLNPDVVGKPAVWIAKQAGFSVPERTNILIAEVNDVGVQEPLSREKLSPVLALIKANSLEDGFDKADRMVKLHGLGHSAAIHTKSKEIAKKFGELVKAIRVIWNSPTTFGGIGDVYNSFTPSLTLGCGSYGKNSVGDNVGALNLINVKKIGERRNNMQWFRVPPKIYFEKNAIEYLQVMPNVERVMIITDRAMVELGFVAKITAQLDKRPNHVVYQLFADVEPEPDITTIERGVQLMRSFKPDTIIALGGGSPMDAAKGMWMFYEQPDIDFKDTVQKFMDIRKRAFRFPKLGEKVQLVCIPTTSGTGSEITPFAVISDKAKGKKYPLADYALTPSVAIIDSGLVRSLPAKVVAETGMDALTHAIEAYVSIMASDYTDGIALQAIKLIFTYLERSFKNGANDIEAQEKMQNASTLAGIAFGNAFLGIVHSLSHKIGAKYHTIHGRNNACLLPHVIMYNGTTPDKVATWPKYSHFVADKKYAEIARVLGYNFDTVEEGVCCLAKAVYDLALKVDCKVSFEEFGIDRSQWDAGKEQLAYDAFEDQCTPANPRLPLIKDMIKILDDAYVGKVDYNYNKK